MGLMQKWMYNLGECTAKWQDWESGEVTVFISWHDRHVLVTTIKGGWFLMAYIKGRLPSVLVSWIVLILVFCIMPWIASRLCTAACFFHICHMHMIIACAPKHCRFPFSLLAPYCVIIHEGVLPCNSFLNSEPPSWGRMSAIINNVVEPCMPHHLRSTNLL